MLSLFYTIMVLLVGCSENQEIIGDWLYLKPKEESNIFFVECPDEIRFKSDGTYVIVNDCYGIGKSQLVEDGFWNLKGDQINLKNRNLSTNYSITKSIEDPLVISIESISEDTLMLNIDGKVEIYKKIP
ncbi:MAG: hypothetical protein AAF620_13335 [Bacteroidota bacterium]